MLLDTIGKKHLLYFATLPAKKTKLPQAYTNVNMIIFHQYF